MGRVAEGSAPVAAGPAHSGSHEGWIAYESGGGGGSAVAGVVSVGGGGRQIFSLRPISGSHVPPFYADLLTSGGFDPIHIRAADLRQEDAPRDPYSAAQQREAALIGALMHNRPVMRLRVDQAGRPHVQDSPAQRRFEGCARRLLRSAIEAQIAVGNGAQRRLQEERLQGDPAQIVSAPVDNAALLLRLAGLSLPDTSNPVSRPSVPESAQRRALSTQYDMRARQIQSHGRHVRLQVNLLSTTRSAAANICRSLAFQRISATRRDSCTIEGVIDRRDGWPITLSISREGETADAATETRYRSFHRLTPLQPFVPPQNPCRSE
jgi:hypothetical protein